MDRHLQGTKANKNERENGRKKRLEYNTQNLQYIHNDASSYKVLVERTETNYWCEDMFTKQFCCLCVTKWRVKHALLSSSVCQWRVFENASVTYFIKFIRSLAVFFSLHVLFYTHTQTIACRIIYFMVYT